MEVPSSPLAERMRPKSIADYEDQEHLVGKDGIISHAIKTGLLPSIILWGPPGSGKTTLASLLAGELGRVFFPLSAINSGVKDIRDVIEKAEKNSLFSNGKKPILFIDEIHRFSKSQQDALLGAVEKGTICLIGATTENPSFEVIPALISRCQVYTLKPISVENLKKLLHKACEKDEWILKSFESIEFKEYDALLLFSGGDARKLLNVFELVLSNFDKNTKVEINNEIVKSSVHNNIATYDKSGEMHYDIISAFIKSIRGSDPNAAVYWLARMIEGGEDPLFIARRLIILASEDIGNANPTALVIANNCFQAVNVIGFPEARIIISQATTYLACSPKSNAAYMAINTAQQIVKETGDLSVPLHLRNAPTKLMKDLNYGSGYKYAHDYPQNFVKQEFLPEKISKKIIYNPSNNPRENEMRKRLEQIWKDWYKY
jgi:putative ATPase